MEKINKQMEYNTIKYKLHHAQVHMVSSMSLSKQWKIIRPPTIDGAAARTNQKTPR